MPPVRKPRPARPQTAHCRYLSARGERCTRLATVAGELCRRHAIELGQQLGAIPNPRGAPGGSILDALQGVIQGGAFGEVLEDAIRAGIEALLTGQHRVPRAAPPPRSGSPPRSPPGPSSGASSPPPRRPLTPDQEKARSARMVLGFDQDEPLTVPEVQARRRELARIFHPDRPKGSVDRMKRINHAADELERILAKPA